MFTYIAKPLIHLSKSKCRFGWDYHCEKAFANTEEIFEKRACEVFIVEFFHLDVRFILDTNVRKGSIRRILVHLLDGHDKF